MSGCTWPERDAVEAWLKDHGIDVPRPFIEELASNVSAFRIRIQPYIDHKRSCAVFEPQLADAPLKECNCGLLKVWGGYVPTPAPAQPELRVTVSDAARAEAHEPPIAAPSGAVMNWQQMMADEAPPHSPSAAEKPVTTSAVEPGLKVTPAMLRWAQGDTQPEQRREEG